MPLTLSHVRLHGLLLYPPGSPSMSSGMALPLLSHYYDATWGSLHVEHSVIFTLCSTLRQWVQAYGVDNSRGAAVTVTVRFGACYMLSQHGIYRWKRDVSIYTTRAL